MKRLPERVFYSLNDIEKLWHADPSNLKQWLMRGQLSDTKQKSHSEEWL